MKKRTTVHRPRVRSVELSGFRSAYPQFDADAKAFGLEVAIYNAGFTRGNENGRAKLAESVLPVIDMLAIQLAEHKHKWTAAQRRAYERAVRDCKRGLK
jgi:hypothetical protein